MPDGTVENEMCPVFVATTADPVRPDAGEVDDFSWVPWAEFRASVLDGSREVSPWCVEQVRHARGPARPARPPRIVRDAAAVQAGPKQQYVTDYRPSRWPGWSTSRSGAGGVDVDGHRAAVEHLAAEQHPGERVADGGLHQPAQRPGAVRRVVAGAATATRARPSVTLDA